MLAVGFHNARDVFKPVKCMAVGGAENEGNPTLLQFGCNANGKVTVEVDIKHHAIEPWLPDFLLGAVTERAVPATIPPSHFTMSLAAIATDRKSILDNKDTRSLKFHVTTALSDAATQQQFSYIAGQCVFSVSVPEEDEQAC